MAGLLKRLHLPDSAAFTMAGSAQSLIDGLLQMMGKYATARDFSLLHDLMYRKGWAVPLGEPFVTPAEPPADDAANAAVRLRALLDTP
jgi:hypothetical protein